jgi:hypothetical protein
MDLDNKERDQQTMDQKIEETHILKFLAEQKKAEQF